MPHSARLSSHFGGGKDVSGSGKHFSRAPVSGAQRAIGTDQITDERWLRPSESHPEARVHPECRPLRDRNRVEALSSAGKALTLGKSEYATHGERVVAGQQLMQAATDIFLGGWQHIKSPLDGQERDFYVRELKDWKMSLVIEAMSPPALAAYGKACGWALARAHARSGDRIAISAYLGKSDAFDRAIA